jgi:hypothetical protein
MQQMRKVIIQTAVLEEFEQVFGHFRKYHVNILLGDFNVKVGR